MKKSLILLLALTLLYTAGICTAVLANDAVTVKVGVYENEPRIFTDDQGKVSGFWPDIIEYIAAREGWEIEYVHGTWAECMARLENHKIDMMPNVAYTPEWAAKYDYSEEPAYITWAMVYAPAGTSIESILDLEGKKVAVMEGSNNVEGPDGIKTLTKNFNVNCTFIYLDTYVEVFEMLDKKEADAGVVGKDFAYTQGKYYNVIQTPIIFQPAKLYFAFPKGSNLTQYLIEKVDSNLDQLKGDINSAYYQSLNKWFGVNPIEKLVFLDWVKWMLIFVGVVAVLFGGGALILRTQVRKRTKELAEEVAERKKAEEALRKSVKVLNDTGEMAKVGGWEFDVTTLKQTWTEELYRIHEIDIDHKPTVAEGISFYAPEAVPIISKAVQRAIDHGEPFNLELPFITAKGNHIWVHVIGKAVQKDGKTFKVEGIFQDITERRQAEEEHLKNIEYRELDKLKTNLLSTVSHELRTPLASIKGYSSLLLMYDRKLDNAQKKESLEAIDRSTDRLTELIEHLLDMSRLDAGLFRLNLEAVKPGDIFLTAVAEAKLRSPKYQFKTEVKDRLPMVTADARRLRQVIDNLLDNAIKYSPEGTEITVRAEVKAEELLVSVADLGRGIPAAELNKIFDRMYRIEQRLGKDPGGLGLGLSLCKALVEAHGGRIWVESQVEKGSTFFFTIPLKKRRQHAEKDQDKGSADNRR